MSVRANLSWFGPFAEDIHRADHSTTDVLDRLDVHQRYDAGSIGSLDSDFLVTQCVAGGEDIGHGAFGVRHQAPIQPVQAIGTAIANGWVAELWRAAP